ncbi:MAG: glycosyltransferase family 39 protein [Bacteroidales bacterium]|nr:glycosyltransferase family 39 protein [Bacteroidales bacterium]
MSVVTVYKSINQYYKRNSSTIWLLGIVFLGVVLRLYGIWNIPFTDDELSVESRLHYQSFRELIQLGVLCEGHPAGVQVFVWLWTKCFGFSEIAIRFPFLILGIAIIPLSYQIGKQWFNANVGLFIAAYFTTSQYIIFHSVVARPYVVGLFFSLLMIRYWSLLIFEQKYTLKNMIIMGLSAALCAYTHQFSMFFAFLLGVAGLAMAEKKHIWKYILACLFALVLYLPHLPILLKQMQLGGVGGADGWLGKPTPVFFEMYFKYIFHFSIYVYVIVAIVVFYYAFKNRKQWQYVWKKQVLSVLLFLIPLFVAYFYSIHINPVLQFNVLIFSFPFVLLFLFSMIDSNFNVLKKIFLLLMLIAMLYSLLVERRHYELMRQQWFEISAKKAIECKNKCGNQQLGIMLNMEIPFLSYYERKYNEHIPNLLYREYALTDKSFHTLLQQQQSDYLLVGGLSDVQLAMIKEIYPYVLSIEKCFTTEIILFSKIPQKQVIKFKPLYTRHILLDTVSLDSTIDFITIDELYLSEISPSRYVLICVAAEYQSKDTNSNAYLVLETWYKDKLLDWRGVETKNITRKAQQKQYVYIPLRYELLIKNSRKMRNVRLKTYLWYPDQARDVYFSNAYISVYEDNEIIYGLVERLK